MTSTAEKKALKRKKKPEARPAGSFWRTGTWIGFLIFVSAWMFVLGILVGRGTISTQFEFNDSQKALYSLAEKAAKTAEKPVPTQEMTDNISADPFDGLKKSGGDGSKKDDLYLYQTDQSKSDVQKPSQQPKKPKKKLKAKPKPSSRPIPPQSTPSSPEPVLLPKREKIASTYRTLQTAALQDLAGAKQMVARLQQEGYKAYVASAAVSGKGVQHRVRIGPYKNEADASAALDRLKKTGINAIMLK
jgi:cell division septation protein DedD